jgi:preprotein translocase subunit SecG
MGMVYHRTVSVVVVVVVVVVAILLQDSCVKVSKKE